MANGYYPKRFDLSIDREMFVEVWLRFASDGEDGVAVGMRSLLSPSRLVSTYQLSGEGDIEFRFITPRYLNSISSFVIRASLDYLQSVILKMDDGMMPQISLLIGNTRLKLGHVCFDENEGEEITFSFYGVNYDGEDEEV